MNPVLSVRRLEKRFGAVVAADALTLDVPAGQKISLIGANGAGKTTFVNMVTGYMKPSAGEIYFRERSITKFKPRQVMRMGICRSFQIPQLFPELSVLDNLLIAVSSGDSSWPSFLRPLKSPARIAAADRMLTDYDMAGFRDVVVATLPQGIKKLVDIAMAMVSRPAVLLLDEPTSGVSVAEKFGMLETIMAAVKRAQTRQSYSSSTTSKSSSVTPPGCWPSMTAGLSPTPTRGRR